jgi:predicted O-methyltransferase YrrM
MQERMRYLEEIDSRDRLDGTPRAQRLRQIPRDTGMFLAILAASAPEGDCLEIGASAGYSTLWLALAAIERERQVTTFEVLPEKVRLARDTFQAAGVEHIVELVEGDARKYLPKHEHIAFCFLDAEKEVYGDCYELVIPRLVKGGILVADNAINHRETLQPMLDRALNDPRVDAVILPVGKGELVCRKI